MKKVLVVVCVLLLLVVSGCTLQTTKQSIQDSKDLQLKKAEAHEIFAKAHKEFFTGVSSTENMQVQELTMDQLGVKEMIIGLAFEGYNTGNASKLEQYLKEQGLYTKYQQIAEKYDLVLQQEILDTKVSGITTQSVSISFFDSFIDGDFFCCYGSIGSSSSAKLLGFFIPGIWKHAGIMDTQAPDRSAPILSASDDTTSGFCVGYETKAKWANESSVSAWRVYGRTDTKARAAVEYGKQFIGKPYNVFVSRSSNDSWYCSKVVYRGWLSQGIDIEPTPWINDTWVTPTDLTEDNDTYWIGGDRS